MIRPAIVLFSLVLFLASVSTANGWGDEGHETVGRIASLRIKAKTKQRIAHILTSGETLASISTWADRVKYRVGEHDPDPDTNSFLQDEAHNKDNPNWHFVDLPLDCPNYQMCNGFTSDNDIVHLINVCIRTLLGQPDSKHPLSKHNALRLLVHFIGDLHQPLHVGSGFIDPNGPNHLPRIATNPTSITQQHLASDRGGNELIIDSDRKNLHSFWDFDLVRSLMTDTHKDTSAALGSFLMHTVPQKTSWPAQGAIATWAAQWATDSLNASRNHAYKSVAIVGQRVITVLRNGQPLIQNGQTVMETVYDINRPAEYETLNRNLVREQLAKAGFRLAKLLDAIYTQ